MLKQFTKPFLLFLGAFLVLNLVQSAYTQIIYDEAYYWYYAQNLSWGYFDHPPMVALLVWISSLFFEGELGVRFMSCLMSAGTISIIWLLIENPKKEKYVPHFFLLLFSMALFNAYGFLTLPDTPLLFFTALFLLVYKAFLKNSSVLTALSLGLVMACLMYSKYHAVLIIVFILLSNLKLLKNGYAWLAVGISLCLYAPHLIWLFENDFVSIKYHISERPNQAYSFDSFTLAYFLNLIVNFGVLFPWFYLALFKTKPKDAFTKALLYLTYGVILFFFLSSFHRRTQAQWVIAICIPMAILTYNYILQNENSRKWVFKISIIGLIILLYARVWLVYQPLLPKVFETHGNKEWVSKLSSYAGDTPVVFENSYRESSMYHFYSGKPSFSFNNIFYRQNQYSIDSAEFRLQNKRIAYLSKYVKSGDFSYLNPGGDEVFLNFKDDFESFRKLRVYIDEDEVDLKKKQGVLKVYNPYQQDVPLDKIKIKVGFLNNYKQVKDIQELQYHITDSTLKILKAKDTSYFNYRLPASKLTQPRYLKFSISENGLISGLNSSSIKIKE